MLSTGVVEIREGVHSSRTSMGSCVDMRLPILTFSKPSRTVVKESVVMVTVPSNA